MNYKILYNIRINNTNKVYYSNNINDLYKNDLTKITKLMINNLNINEIDKRLINLENLIIINCNNIKEIPKINTLKVLHINKCDNLININEDLINLEKLNIKNCIKIKSLSNKYIKLKELIIEKTNINKIYDTYNNLEVLQFDYSINSIPNKYYNLIFKNYI